MSIADLNWSSELEDRTPALKGMAAHLAAAPGGDRTRNRWKSMALSVLGHGAVAYAILYLSFAAPKKTEVHDISVSIAQTQVNKTDPLPLPKLEHVPQIAQPSMPQIDIATTPSPITIQAAPPAAPAPVQETKALSDAPTTPPRFDADYLNNPAPVYPNMSRRLREVGVVQLRVRVSAGGDPLEIQLLQSSGYARLDDAARTAVQKWKFQAARRSGSAIEAWVVVPVEFSLTHR
jgi:protein TonB